MAEAVGLVTLILRVEHAAILGVVEEEQPVEKGESGAGDVVSRGLGLLAPEEFDEPGIDIAEDNIREAAGDLLVGTPTSGKETVEEAIALSLAGDPRAALEQQVADAQVVQGVFSKNLSEEVVGNEQAREVYRPRRAPGGERGRSRCASGRRW